MIDLIIKIDTEILTIFSRIGKIVVIDRILIFFTTIGKAGVVWIIITFILLIVKKYRKAVIITAVALLCSLCLISFIIKPLVQRPRPFNEHNEIVLKIKTPSEEYSFPSGHASSSFAAAIAIVLVLRKKVLSILVLSLATIISFSRIYLNVHYTSDVFIGMLCGLLCALLAMIVGKVVIKLFPDSLFENKE